MEYYKHLGRTIHNTIYQLKQAQEYCGDIKDVDKENYRELKKELTTIERQLNKWYKKIETKHKGIKNKLASSDSQNEEEVIDERESDQDQIIDDGFYEVEDQSDAYYFIIDKIRFEIHADDDRIYTYKNGTDYQSKLGVIKFRFRNKKEFIDDYLQEARDFVLTQIL